MACTDDQQPKFKHYCRICKKGFMCGRALGGHMRAHGIADDCTNIDDDDPASDWEEKFGGGGGGDRATSSTRRMYQLRTNPNRLKSCRVCENCGKEFSSWKSFLEHGKCSSDDAESLVSSPGLDGDYKGERRGCQWSKRKRSLRTKVGSFCSAYPNSSEDEDLLLAKCLVELANAGADAEPDQESCGSASREEERRNPGVTAFFSHYPPSSRVDKPKNAGASSASRGGGLFECKACKKVFNSHQALGGHRASHKKVKGCYAAKQDQMDDKIINIATDDDHRVIKLDNSGFFTSKSHFQLEQVSNSSRKSKVHECTICHRVFSTGQALGGHKRCHWITSNSQEPSNSSAKFQLHDHVDHHHHQMVSLPTTTAALLNKSETVLDLNIPAAAAIQADHHDQVAGGLMLLKRDPQNLLSFEVSTDIRLQTWKNLDAETQCDSHHDCQHLKNDQHDASINVGGNVENDNNNSIDHTTSTTKVNQNKNKIVDIISSNGPVENNVDDEADSKVELGKLSDLKDINLSGNALPWLQVGIGSTAEVAVQL